MQQKVSGERYEGMLVELQNVTIVDASLGTGSNTGRVFWSVQDAEGNKMQVRDVSGWIRNDTFDNFCTDIGSLTPDEFPLPQTNSTIAYLRGVIVEATLTGAQQYTIAPRTLEDIGPQTAAAPVISDLVEIVPVPSTTQAQTITAKIVDSDGTVATATLYYAVGLEGSSFTSVPMTEGAGNIWSATIPAMGPDSTYVIYYVSATDNAGNTTNFPNTTGFNSYYLILDNGINSIQDIQFNPLGLNDSPYRNAKLSGIEVTGTVMSSTGLADFGAVVIQESNTSWSGITWANNAVAVSGPNPSSLQRGDVVVITAAKVFEDFGMTKLDSLTYTVIVSNQPLPASITTTNMDSIALNVYDHAEPYESMLLEYTNVTVASTNPDDPGNFGEWSIDDQSGNGNPLRVDDYSNDIGPDFNTDSLAVGETLSYIRGFLAWANSNWKLRPRNRNDIAGFIVSVQNVTDYRAFDIFPNPAGNELHVRFLGSVENVQWTMSDVSGRVLNQSQLKAGVKDFIVPLENLSAGVYFIHAVTAEGKQTVRFVKQ